MVKKSEEKNKEEVKEEKTSSEAKKISPKEFEKKVLELHEKGLTAEKIGQELKNQNIHTKDFEKKITQILKENDAYIKPELKNVEEKLERIKIHFENNKQDKRAKREKDRIFSQLRKIKKYEGLIK